MRTAVGFPALVDEGDSVALRAFDTEATAKAMHRKGLARLFALALKEQVKAIEKLPGLRVAARTSAFAYKGRDMDVRRIGEEGLYEMLRDKIHSVLDTLTYREREIIKLRYGLGDGYSYTLEEVGHIFKVTRERIRQIEAKAVRKLQQPSRSQELVGFLD